MRSTTSSSLQDSGGWRGPPIATLKSFTIAGVFAFTLAKALSSCFPSFVSGRFRLRSFVRGFRILEEEFKSLLKPLKKEGLLIDTLVL